MLHKTKNAGGRFNQNVFKLNESYNHKRTLNGLDLSKISIVPKLILEQKIAVSITIRDTNDKSNFNLKSDWIWELGFVHDLLICIFTNVRTFRCNNMIFLLYKKILRIFILKHSPRIRFFH